MYKSEEKIYEKDSNRMWNLCTAFQKFSVGIILTLCYQEKKEHVLNRKTKTLKNELDLFH